MKTRTLQAVRYYGAARGRRPALTALAAGVLITTLAVAQPVDMDGRAPGISGAEFELTPHGLIASVYLNDVGPYPFLIDPGAAHTVIDESVRRFLRLPLADTPPPSGSAPPPLGSSQVESLTARIAGMTPRQAPVLVALLDGYEAKLGQRIAGVLGRDLLPDPLIIDFGARLFFEDAPVIPGAETEEQAFVASMDSGDGELEFRAIIDGARAERAAIGLTFSGTLGLPYDHAEEFGLTGEDRARLDVAGMPAEGFVTRASRLHVGGAEIRRPLCYVSYSLEQPVIGLDFLRRFRMELRFEEGELHLTPLTQMPCEDPPIEGYGLTPAVFLDGYWTLHVAAGSPAERAGLMTGDYLTHAEGTDLANQPHEAVMERLAGAAGDEIDVIVWREGQTLERRLQAEELL